MHSYSIAGTLLKAAFFCANILSEDSDDSLQQQLLSKYNGGFILQTWSELPHGSGMGTSSILAGTILAALWKVIGKEPDVDAVVHAVCELKISFSQSIISILSNLYSGLNLLVRHRI